VQLPTPSWGNIIAEGRGDLRDAPHIVLIPTVVIFATVLALNHLGDVVRSRFDVRESAL
jgi:peptide/nickel transport system permease protein